MRSVLLSMLVLSACGRSGFDLQTRDGALVDGDGSIITPGDGDLDASTDGAMVSMPDAAVDAAGGLMNAATFTQPTATTPPTARRSTGAALTTGTESLYIFGGYNSGGWLGDFAVYSVAGNSWATPTVGANTPATRERHALAWDATQSIVVMFGGQRPSPILPAPLDELWFYVPGTGWTQIAKAGTWPGARKDLALVYMPHLQKFLMYGGNNGAAAANRFSDVWTLSINKTNGTATWAQLAPTGTAPAQSAGCYAYDAAAHRFIVYGGETQDGTDTNTTFEYLVDTNAWQQDTTSGTTPGGQSFQQCAWDPGTSRVILYGGQNSGGAPTGGSFAYNPATKAWTTLTETAPPGNRSDGGAVYSVTLGKMLWFGGRTAQTTYTNGIVTMDLN